MAMERVWLDWGRPCLPAAAAWLIEECVQRDSSTAANSLCDLSSTACVLPGRRAGRVLLGLLIQRCRERGMQLIPPRMLTPGDLPQLLAPPAKPMASTIESTLAWGIALRQLDANAIKPLLPHRPADDDAAAWHSLAQTAQRLHDELAGQCRSFADVADQAGRMEMLSEAERWHALAKAHQMYRRVLDRCDLIGPQDAFGAAVKSRPLESTVRIALIGVVELNALQRLAISALGDRVAALVHAPASLADSFDDFGCVRTEAWADALVEIDDDSIHTAERPANQAQCVMRSIAAFNGARSAAEITIGLGDAGLSPAIEHAAKWAGISVRSAVGDALSKTGPCRALALLADWGEEPRFAVLAAMIRHPDVEHWIRKRIKAEGVRSGIEDWITLLDEYFTDHLHERVTGAWLGDDKQQMRLKAVYGAVQKLAEPLAEPDRQMALGEWMPPILETLAMLYGGLVVDEGEPSRRKIVEACLALRDIAAALAAAPHELQPRVSAAGAIRILLELAAHENLAERLESDQIEVLGWLELHLDLAPALIIAGLNEGAIPQSVHADAFLPDSLRQRLGLSCNASRYARDAYLLKAILQSRSDVTLIAGRRGADGDPLTPSRLLLACDDQTLLRRIERFCDERIAARSPRAIGLSHQVNGESLFKVPSLPAPLPIPTYMRVTDFRTYLSCPYRYALSKLIGLKGFDDSASELDPLAFGSLSHDVLCAFGQDESINASDDARKIEQFLIKALNERARRWFGSSPLPAVRVQLARLEQRLQAFARRQAALRAEGWRIRYCEHELRGEVSLDIPGQESMPLRGTIDRIDQHERDKTWRILDYKTGDSARSPQETHCGRKTLVALSELEWCDLQLPLYHYLATRSSLGIRGEIQLGYICLPKQSNGVEFHAAEWSKEHLEHAWETARRIVREIRELAPRGGFAPKGEVDGIDDFARICQTTVFSVADSMETADERG